MYVKVLLFIFFRSFHLTVSVDNGKTYECKTSNFIKEISDDNKKTYWKVSKTCSTTEQQRLQHTCICTCKKKMISMQTCILQPNWRMLIRRWTTTRFWFWCWASSNTNHGLTSAHWDSVTRHIDIWDNKVTSAVGIIYICHDDQWAVTSVNV